MTNNSQPTNLREWITKYASCAAIGLNMSSKTCYTKKRDQQMMPVPHREVQRSRTIRDKAKTPRGTDAAPANGSTEPPQPN